MGPRPAGPRQLPTLHEPLHAVEDTETKNALAEPCQGPWKDAGRRAGHAGRERRAGLLGALNNLAKRCKAGGSSALQ